MMQQQSMQQQPLMQQQPMQQQTMQQNAPGILMTGKNALRDLLTMSKDEVLEFFQEQKRSADSWLEVLRSETGWYQTTIQYMVLFGYIMLTTMAVCLSIFAPFSAPAWTVYTCVLAPALWIVNNTIGSIGVSYSKDSLNAYAPVGVIRGWGVVVVILLASFWAGYGSILDMNTWALYSPTNPNTTVAIGSFPNLWQWNNQSGYFYLKDYYIGFHFGMWGKLGMCILGLIIAAIVALYNFRHLANYNTASTYYTQALVTLNQIYSDTSKNLGDTFRNVTQQVKSALSPSLKGGAGHATYFDNNDLGGFHNHMKSCYPKGEAKFNAYYHETPYHRHVPIYSRQ